jgi:protein involved in polysaccharide export with SLBB domain
MLFRLCGAIALLVIGSTAVAQTQTSLQQGVATASPLDPNSSAQPAGRQSAEPPSGDSSSAASINSNGGQTYRPTVLGPQSTTSPLSLEQLIQSKQNILDQNVRAKGPPTPGEFEEYVTRVIGRRLQRFGQDLILPGQRDFAAPATASVPPDYRLNVGDTIVLSLTGSVDGSFDREIDTNGNIFLPSVGSVRIAGVRYGDVRGRISDAIGTKYRDYTVNVSVKKLRGVRVYVTGFANNPGAFTISSLSTMANAVLQAGGPSSGGSFRSVKLYRDGAQVADFDLYELLRGGSRVNDAVLQNEDVLFIPPAGDLVAVIGSVQQEAIYEIKPGETLQQALAIAGGPNVLGDPDRFLLYRTREYADLGPREIARAQSFATLTVGGDILQVLSKGSLIQPVVRQSVLVRVEGEVNKPGNYFVPPNASMQEVLGLAGGLTPRAFPFGTKLMRQSVREQQRESYAEAIDQLERAVASAPLNGDTSLSDNQRAAQIAGAREILQQLRKTEPDGRVVMDIASDARELPAQLVMENNDRVMVPPRGTTVGVFGAVYRPASFLLEINRLRVRDYLDRAGGPQRYADKSNIILVRANGAVLSRRRGALNATVLPGDVVFVPVKTGGANFWTRLKEISTIVFQLGLAGAVVANISQ